MAYPAITGHGFMVGLSHSAELCRQRFFVTFMARYQGLPKLGCDILSSMGMIIPSTNYDHMLKEVAMEAKAKARYLEMVWQDVILQLAKFK